MVSFQTGSDSTGCEGNSATLEFSATVAAGTDTYQVVGAHGLDRGAPTVNEVRWGGSGGTLLTELGSANSGDATAALWGQAAPSVATQNVYIEMSATGRLAGGHRVYEGVHQTTPTGTVVTDFGSISPATASLTIATDGMGVDAITTDSEPVTVGADQTERYNFACATHLECGGSDQPSGQANDDMTWTFTNVDYGLVAVPLEPAVAGGETFNAEPGTYAITGQSIGPRVGLPADPGSYGVTGVAMTPAIDMPADPGSYLKTGVALGSGLQTPLDPGSYSLTGSATQFGVTMPADAGVYSISGATASLLAAYLESLDPGTYNLTGAVASFGIRLPADAGAYSLTGAPVGITVTLPADLGNYVVTGVAADLIDPVAGFVLNAEPGAYSITGLPITLDISIPVDPGAYTITGAPITPGITFPADPGSYALAGVAASLLASYLESLLPGFYGLTGQDVGTGIVLPASPGIYSLTGAEISIDISVPLDAGSYSLLGAAATFIDPAAAAVPTAEGLQFTVPMGHLHYDVAEELEFTVPIGRLHYDVKTGRLHWTINLRRLHYDGGSD